MKTLTAELNSIDSSNPVRQCIGLIHVVNASARSFSQTSRKYRRKLCGNCAHVEFTLTKEERAFLIKLVNTHSFGVIGEAGSPRKATSRRLGLHSNWTWKITVRQNIDDAYKLLPTRESMDVLHRPRLFQMAAFFTSIAKLMPIAILMGLLTSLVGYSKQTPPESFELDKFLATAMISVIIGILTLGFGGDYTTAEEWLANGAITLYIYRIAKIIAIKVGWIKLPQPQPTPQT